MAIRQCFLACTTLSVKRCGAEMGHEVGIEMLTITISMDYRATK